MKYRMLALLLALVLVFALGGCQTEPEQTQPPTQAPTEPPETTIPEPTAPDALDAYSEAVAALEAAGAVTLDVVYTETTTAGTQSLTYGSEQVLTYNGLGTQAPVISLEEDLYTPDRKEDEEEEEEEDPDFSEIYADGMIYQNNDMLGKFSVELSDDEAARRYVPAALLDAALYEDMTAELDGDAVVVTFGAPTAPEIWAAPEDAQLVEATGSAVILDGQLQ